MKAGALRAVAMPGLFLLLASCWAPPVTVVGRVADDVRSGAAECEIQFFSERFGPGEPVRVGAGGQFVLDEHIGNAGRSAGENCRLAITCDGVVRLNIGVRLWYEKEGWFDVGTIDLATRPSVTAVAKRGNWMTDGPYAK
jgi:hypothetical protein